MTSRHLRPARRHALQPVELVTGSPRRSLPLVLLTIALASLAGAASSGAAHGPPTRRVSGHFIYVVNNVDDTACGWGIGFEFPSVPGAVSYSIQYWDGYYKTVEPASVTTAEFVTNDKPFLEKKQIASGDYFYGITGGTYSPPCNNDKGDPTEGGRFDNSRLLIKAVFPSNYKPKKPAVDVSIVLPDQKPTVGSSVDVDVKVTAGKVALSKVHLGKGLKGTGSVAAITDRPVGLNGFSLGAHKSRVFTFTLEAKKEGTETLSAQAEATSSDGVSATGSDSKGLEIGVKALSVTVTPSPSTVRLELNGDQLVPKPVKVTVTIKNDTKEPVENAALQGNLVVGYLHYTPTVNAEVPIRPDSGPSPESFASIAPGATVQSTYTVLVKGDGDYSLQALVVGGSKSGRVTGVGEGELDVSAPVLVVSTAKGRGASLPDTKTANNPTGLIIAGTPFTIKLTLQNLSYVHKIAVNPFTAGLTGNAFGGQIALAGGPIEPSNPDALPVPSEYLTLDPRQTLDAEVIVYTTESQGVLQNMGRQGVGGTRAYVKIPTPGATYVADDGSAGDAVAENDVAVDGDTSFTYSIDDRDLTEPQQPKTWLTGAAYFTAGLVIGAGNFFAGMVHAIPDLASLVGQGLVAIPPALYAYAQFEAELWRSIQHDPVALAAFTNVFTAQAYLVYKHAEGFANSDFKKQLDAALNQYFTKLSNDWYSGDWGAAVEQVGEVTGENLAPVAGPKLATWLVRGIAPGVLAKSEEALGAFKKATEKAYTQFGEELTARYPRFASALDAITALKNAPPGYEFSNTQIRQLYGLTQAEAEFLRAYAKANDLLIVVRSRAVESIAWLNGQVIDGVKWAGAVLKPEAIKLKNVGLYDVKYLGYSPNDLGRVVIAGHDLPSVTEVEAAMRANKVKEGSADWNAILKRLSQREEEFTKELGTGEVKDLIAAAKQGKMTMNWNFADNAVDPGALTSEPVTYDFRMADESGNLIPPEKLDSYKGTMIPQYFVKGEWRCVTGDVDFLQIVKGNGRPLLDEERSTVYQALAKSVVGFMHPESATWTLEGEFNFDKKINEFVRAGTCLQFAPDGLARAVQFAVGDFKDKLNYAIGWLGGVLNPSGAIVPVPG
jgi:hypothetical protein